MRETRTVLVHSAHGRYCQLPELAAAGLIHGFSCRDLALPETGGTVADFLAAGLGIQDLRGAWLRQQHTSTAHLVGRGHDLADPSPVGDALVALEPGWRLTLQTADCLPLLLIDAESRCYAAVHAGWRGTLGGVLTAALALWKAQGFLDLSRTWMAMGPGIRACCFEIGDEVVMQFLSGWKQAADWFRPGPHERQHLDLAAANRHQAIAAGISPDRILDPNLCTSCRHDLFYSYRADGGTTGRIITQAAIR